MSVQLQGFSELINKLNRNASRIEDTCQDALLECGNDLQQKAVDITPKDTGALRGSAHTDAEPQAGKPSVIVAFDEEYAIYVHENLEAHHPVGQAKFLEQPLKENADNYIKYVGKKVMDLLKS